MGKVFRRRLNLLLSGLALLHRCTQIMSFYGHAACTVVESWINSLRFAPSPLSYLGMLFIYVVNYTKYTSCAHFGYNYIPQDKIIFPDNKLKKSFLPQTSFLILSQKFGRPLKKPHIFTSKVCCRKIKNAPQRIIYIYLGCAYIHFREKCSTREKYCLKNSTE